MALVPSLPETKAVAGETGWKEYQAVLRGRYRNWAAVVLEPGNAGKSPFPIWLTPLLDARCLLSGWSTLQREAFVSGQFAAAGLHLRFRASESAVRQRERWLASGTVMPQSESHFTFAGEGNELAAAVREGLVDIQDSSSQRSLTGLDLQPGQRVWDACAGTGGKTLLAAESLKNKGALIATEVAAGKLKALGDRVRRSGWQNIRLVGWNGRTLPDFGREVTQRGGFDRVILDVPCSASGTWRRDPEGRYRLTRDGLRKLTETQGGLLDLAWSAVKPGGRLVYITCSWLVPENEGQIDNFLGNHQATLAEQHEWGLPHDDGNSMFSAVLVKPVAP
jgi:16S rRNA (cytosine967-C5)-methyltransferase